MFLHATQIMGGYSFLMQQYRKGDGIWLFGFSRGAYTARCLAGMLHKRQSDRSGTFDPTEIKEGETGLLVEIQGPCVTGDGKPKSKTDVKEVWFAGCHSDVGGGSVPNNTPHSLAFVPFRWMVEQTILCQTGILYLPGALHSIGLTTDPFIEVHTNSSQLDGGIEGYLKDSTVVSDNVDESDPQSVAKKGKASTSDTNGEAGGTSCQLQSQEQEETQVQREIKGEAQAVRGAIKGSNSSPQWLDPTKGQQQRGSEDAQLQFTSVERPELPNSPSDDFITGPLEPPHNVERQALDLRSKFYDPLKTKPAWWILEVIPMFNRYMDCNGRWHQTFGANFGRPRKIKSEEGPYLHTTVRERMESGIGYKPRARFMEGIDKARWTQ
ncbi:hypothetical protein FRB97_001674 [Tulasnella sp. 331]|nr:hypothetical protein FRB97_001674 [Tulasnella sp. 331]